MCENKEPVEDVAKKLQKAIDDYLGLTPKLLEQRENENA